jgi:predicted  nucleic acid-binding Zn-ribbon protein
MEGIITLLVLAALFFGYLMIRNIRLKMKSVSYKPNTEIKRVCKKCNKIWCSHGLNENELHKDTLRQCPKCGSTQYEQTEEIIKQG